MPALSLSFVEETPELAYTQCSVRLACGQGLTPERCVIQAELGDRGRSAAPLKMSGDRGSPHVESVTYKISTAQDERAAVLYEGGTRTAVPQNAKYGSLGATCEDRAFSVK